MYSRRPVSYSHAKNLKSSTHQHNDEYEKLCICKRLELWLRRGFLIMNEFRVSFFASAQISGEIFRWSTVDGGTETRRCIVFQRTKKKKRRRRRNVSKKKKISRDFRWQKSRRRTNEIAPFSNMLQVWRIWADRICCPNVRYTSTQFQWKPINADHHWIERIFRFVGRSYDVRPIRPPVCYTQMEQNNFRSKRKIYYSLFVRVNRVMVAAVAMELESKTHGTYEIVHAHAKWIRIIQTNEAHTQNKNQKN